MKDFFFDIPNEELLDIAKYSIKGHVITFKDISQLKAENKLQFLIDNHFSELKSKVTNNKVIYIHKNSGIPLIGNLAFGIVDKGSDIIEIKPISGCNINCIFCSVNEGIVSNKCTNYLIEREYLVVELKKLLDYKKTNVDIYINPQGEPLLYPEIIELIHNIARLKYVSNIAMITNGFLLTEDKVDQLIDAGLSQINISVNSLDEKKAKMLAGTSKYDTKKILALIKHIKKTKLKLILTPVVLFGINDSDIEVLIKFAKENNIEIGIQNFLKNKRGRNPAKERPWDKFFDFLKELELKYGIKLLIKRKLSKTKEYAIPNELAKNNIIKAQILAYGQYLRERIAVSHDRNITVINCETRLNISTKIRILKNNHNIFVAEKI